ncbi:MAG TPA: hypothetical protein VK356_02405, partial [Thermomicrobiales bacterium]|nr:hypothetical protein [Thermomicrobiales bacterium]
MASRTYDDPERDFLSSNSAQAHADTTEPIKFTAAFLEEICDLVAGELPGVIVSFMDESGCI